MTMILREAKVVYSSRRVTGSRRIAHSKDAYGVLSEYGLPDLAQENFVVIHLNAQHQVVSVQTVAMGSLSDVQVHPREIFRGAILAGAEAVILAHNHPSGDPKPSSDDLAITERLKAVGEMVGIPVLDHLVVAGEKYESLGEAGVL